MPLSARNEDARHRPLRATTGAPRRLVGRNYAGDAIPSSLAAVVGVALTTEGEAIRIANDSIYGLGGGVLTGNTARGFNVARQIRGGNVSVQTVGSATSN